jgi:hypothetical protein
MNGIVKELGVVGAYLPGVSLPARRLAHPLH